MISRTTPLAVLLALPLAGCAAQERWNTSGAVARHSEHLTAPVQQFTAPGRMGLLFGLAGRGLNGHDLNGNVLDGHVVVSVSLEGARTAEGRLRLDGTSFRTAEGSAGKIAGTVFTASLDDGSSLPLRVDSVVAAARRDDLVRYAVSYPSSDGWVPLCGSDGGGLPVLAIPLAGRWDLVAGSPTAGAHIDDGTFTRRWNRASHLRARIDSPRAGSNSPAPHRRRPPRREHRRTHGRHLRRRAVPHPCCRGPTCASPRAQGRLGGTGSRPRGVPG